MKSFLPAYLVLISSSIFGFAHCDDESAQGALSKADAKDSTAIPPVKQTLDTAAYDRKVLYLTNGDTSGRWPVKNKYPLPGAILPFNRIVAYYGNLYSKGMGILGELPEDSMLARLQEEVKKWKEADSTTNVIPALHYIAITAQGSPGKGNTYRLRMPFTQIDKVIQIAQKINALVFLDIQVGLSTLEKELPEFEKYLSMPNVHFGIDPEFSMKSGAKPGREIGTFDAADINYVQEYMAGLVRKNKIPPKILVIHRFTQKMVTNYKNIKAFPEVQVVMDMDGWGFPAKKVNTYREFIYKEPVEFTGFKVFYKNDIKTAGYKTVMQPKDLLKLKPQPIYIQYQ